MGKRLAVVHRIGMAVEEVVGCGNDFITNQREKVTDFDRKVAVADFGIGLRQGATVNAVVPTGIKAAFLTESLRILSIDTINVVDATADIETVAGIDRLFRVDPCLVKVHIVGVVVEPSSAVLAVVAKLGPATNGESVVFTEQREGLAKVAVAQATRAKT